MEDERINPTCAYCNHGLFWVQGYWRCLNEWCGYQRWPVRAEVASPHAYDAAEYNGDDSTSGSGAQGGNDWGNVTGRYTQSTAGGGWHGNRQPSSQQSQDVYQYGSQQHDAYQQHDYQLNNQNGHQQYGQQYDVSRSGYQHSGDQPNAQQPGPPSTTSATIGSWSSAGQTNSPASTETPDNEAASMIGNVDEDRVMPYVEEQPTVGMDARDDQRIAFQAVDQFADNFPEHLNHDTRHPHQSPYPPEVSLSDGSESSDTQSNVE